MHVRTLFFRHINHKKNERNTFNTHLAQEFLKHIHFSPEITEKLHLKINVAKHIKSVRLGFDWKS